jgi:hypothetical protein
VEADIPLASGNTTNAAASPQPATPPAEPSLRDALLTGASAEEIADMFVAASMESATYKCLSLCGHTLAGAGEGEARTAGTASDVWTVLQGHQVSPKDITVDPSILQSPHLVVVVGDYLLPLTAAEKVLAARSRATGEEPGSLQATLGMGDVNEEEEVTSALSAVVEEGMAGGGVAQLQPGLVGASLSGAGGIRARTATPLPGKRRCQTWYRPTEFSISVPLTNSLCVVLLAAKIWTRSGFPHSCSS